MFVTVEVQDMGFSVQWDKGNKLYIILKPRCTRNKESLKQQCKCKVTFLYSIFVIVKIRLLFFKEYQQSKGML